MYKGGISKSICNTNENYFDKLFCKLKKMKWNAENPIVTAKKMVEIISTGQNRSEWKRRRRRRGAEDDSRKYNIENAIEF